MYGKTCLHLAIKLGNAGLTNLFLSRGALSSIPDNNGQTAAHIAAKADNLEVCTYRMHCVHKFVTSDVDNNSYHMT
jgi:ankyrin repeat protein